MRVGGSKGSRSLAHGMEVTGLGNRTEVTLRKVLWAGAGVEVGRSP